MVIKSLMPGAISLSANLKNFKKGETPVSRWSMVIIVSMIVYIAVGKGKGPLKFETPTGVAQRRQ